MEALKFAILMALNLVILATIYQMFVKKLFTADQEEPRILLNEDTRFMIRHSPGSITASIGELKLSWWHLARTTKRELFNAKF